MQLKTIAENHKENNMPSPQQLIIARDRTLGYYRGTGELYREVKAAWDIIITIIQNGGSLEDVEKAFESPPVPEYLVGTCVLEFNR